MDFEDVKIFFSDYSPILLLVGILLVPTILHFSLLHYGYASPYVIRTLSINTVFKGVVGLGLGIVLGYLVTKKFG